MRRAALTLGLLGAIAAGCRRASPPVTRFPDAPVVLISIDTLRADHLPAYGYTAGSTPNIDRLVGEGVVFEDLYSHCPLTLPAHASMLTGLLPPHHGVRDNIGFRLASDHATLATRLRTAGLRTGGAVSAYVLRAATGISQGFEFFDDKIEVEAGTESIGNLQRDGALTTSALSAWIDGQKGARVFAFLHLYEPHSPYTPPPAHRNHALAYDGEISYADELVGRLLDTLRGDGLYDRAVIALTSDHGEGLGDHGEQEHGIFLYREAVHVPLVLRLPGAVRAGTRVRGTIAQADLAPTLLDLAAVAATGLDGVSLRPALDGAAQGHPVYSETFYPRYHFGWSELFAATDARYRYVRAPRPELFDLASDGAERNNLASERASVASGMDGWLARQGASADAAAPEEVPSDVREKLQALGYVGTSAPRPAAGARPDPKDRISSYEDFKRALALRLGGQREEAVRQLRAVVAAHPDMRDAWEILGATLAELDRKQEAAAAFDRTIALDPTGPEPHLELARLLALEGKREAALQHLEIAAGRDPGRAYETMAQVQLDLGQTDAAAEDARRSVAADASRPMGHYVLGVAAQRAGRYEEALEDFRRAEAANRLQKGSVILDLHARMADCLARLGREKEAEAEFQAEIAAIPWSRDGRVGLAMLYRSQGRDAEARTALEGLVSSTRNPDAETYWTVVKTFALLGDEAGARDWASRARARFPRDPRFRP
jgi:arylsulfatase A-like enzyme/tetratricopeptide (TPR) repeat protein